MLAHLRTSQTCDDAPPSRVEGNARYNDAVATTLKRRVVRAGGWHLIKRAIKLIRVDGSVFAVGLAGYEIKKKGLIPGVAHVGLDVIPVVGATKNVIEIFTGDLIPDKKVAQTSVCVRTSVTQLESDAAGTDQ